jgi:nucleoside-diphosphate-sugar epimerase
MSTNFKTSESQRELLVLGAYGALGTGITDAAVADPSWRVVTAGRRPPPAHHFSEGTAPPNVSVDLLDRRSIKTALSSLEGVTDLAFSAYFGADTMAKSVDANIAILKNTLEVLSERRTPLRHVVLMGGAKSYGFHLGSMKTPAKESDPRLAAPIFYHQQEDLLAEWAQRNGATWTVLRPHMVFEPSINSPMNLVTALGTYAAISRELGVPLCFPGSLATWDALPRVTPGFSR